MSNRFFPNYDGYKITSKYGSRVLNGAKSMHNGIDLVARAANNISAVDEIMAHTGGVVAATGYDNSAGNYVYIEVQSGVRMAYFHLHEVYVKKGQRVDKGEKIGYMGNTGNSFGAHLHWGIKVLDKWIDPTGYLNNDFVIGDEVVVKLNILRRGMRCEQVKVLQGLLINEGIDCGKSGIDGSFGGDTEKALKEYQKEKGLTVDGICGRVTWECLLK